MLTLTKVLPALISSGSFTGSFYGTSSYSKRALTASYALNASGGSGTSGTSGATGTSGTSGNSGSSGTSGNSGTSGSSGSSGNNGSSGTSGGGASLNTGSAYPITSSWSRKAITASYLTTISQSLIPAKNNTYSLGDPTNKWKDIYVSTASIYFDNYPLTVNVTNNIPRLNFFSSSIVTVPIGSNTNTASYALKALRALSASYVPGGGVGSSGTSGTSGATGSSGTNGSSGTSGNSGTSGSSGQSGTSATAGSSGTSGVGSPGTSGTAGSSGTSSTATLQTGSIAKQTILYNVVSGSQNVITGLNLSGNKWGVDIKEEWDAKSVTGDQYYNSCSILLHLNGSNGSTTFVDNGPNNLTVTGAGASISTAQSKFGGASAVFSGGNAITWPASNLFAYGLLPFTVEFWVYSNSVSSEFYAQTISGQNYFYIGISSGTLYFGFGSGGGTSIAGGSIPTGTWINIALVREGTGTNQTKLYINGTQSAVGTCNFDFSNTSYVPTLGRYSHTVYNTYNGYIDEFRITKGIARYTSNFTPRTSEFPNNAASTQYATKYVGLIGGLNDRSVDYGVQKLSDTSLKVVKMSQTTSPFPSGSLSSSVDRVYVNVLDYNKVNVTSSYARNALTASYSLKSGNALRTGSLYPITASRAVSSSYLLGGSQILTADKTVSFSSSFTTAQIQALIDAQPKNLGGKSLTFKFADGTYNLSTGLYFTSFSNGSIYINGNSSNNTVAFAKNVTISGSGNSPIFISTNSTYTEVNYLRLAVNTSAYAGSLTIENTNAVVNYCSLTNYPRSIVGGSGHGILAQGRAAIWIKTCYFNFLDAAIVSVYNSIINAQSNSQGSNASIAYLAYGGIIQVQNTGLTGVTTYSTGVGGLIVRPSGTTIGT